jgi:hypothetical protein
MQAFGLWIPLITKGLPTAAGRKRAFAADKNELEITSEKLHFTYTIIDAEK